MPEHQTFVRDLLRCGLIGTAHALARGTFAGLVGRHTQATLDSFRSWPPWAFYGPVGARALWRAVQYRDLSLVAIANPLANQESDVLSSSKCAIFDSMAAAGREWIAPFLVVSRSAGRNEETSQRALSLMKGAGLSFPIVAKPDRGSGGKGVQLIGSARALSSYVAAFPSDQDFLLQELVAGPYEAGIMYVRPPGVETGQIQSLAIKDAPTVGGDGRTTLGQLIVSHARARRLREVALSHHAERLGTVPAPGEQIELVFARNRCGGAACSDGRDLVTPELTRRIDEIARSLPAFHIGRFDLRFSSPEQLADGRGFRILEVNCGASEPLTAWDARNSVFDAWRAYFAQVDRLYSIGAANRELGHRSPGTVAFLRGLWHQHWQMRKAAAGGEK